MHSFYYQNGRIEGSTHDQVLFFMDSYLLGGMLKSEYDKLWGRPAMWANIFILNKLRNVYFDIDPGECPGLSSTVDNDEWKRNRKERLFLNAIQKEIAVVLSKCLYGILDTSGWGGYGRTENF